MKCVKRLLCLIIMCIPVNLLAQESGIKWTSGLSWEQVKQKAKVENKYIFLDIFATWCVSCKLMDKEVYVNDTIGDFFNNKFISVKVQVDRTSKDNAETKSWFDDADAIAKQYHVRAFPSYIFLNPQGEVTEMETGYWGVKYFLTIGQSAVKPGQLYKDPYKRYWEMVEDYQRGIVKYDSLDFMISQAKSLNDSVAKPQLMKTYTDYLVSLSHKQRFTKKNVQFWGTLNLSSKSILFQWMLKNEEEVDKLMYRGFASTSIFKTITREIIQPFFEEQNRDKNIPMSGMYMTVIGGESKADYAEADWDKLHMMISKNYGNRMTKRMVLLARNEWYIRHWNGDAKHNVWLRQSKKYSEDLVQQYSGINDQAWNTFQTSSNKKTINQYAQIMKAMLDIFLTQGNLNSKHAAMMDTYASLLYKLGKVKEALNWEEKAIQIYPANKEYVLILEQMKKGKPVYGVLPLSN